MLSAKLHRFESFIPKNLENRQGKLNKHFENMLERFKPVIEKEKSKLIDLINELQKNIDNLKNVKTKDEKEQRIINYLKNSIVKITYNIHVNVSSNNISCDLIFLNDKDKPIGSYDMEDAHDSYYDKHFYLIFNNKTTLQKEYNMSHHEINQLTLSVLKMHLKLDISKLKFIEDGFFPDENNFSKSKIVMHQDDIDYTYLVNL